MKTTENLNVLRDKLEELPQPTDKFRAKLTFTRETRDALIADITDRYARLTQASCDPGIKPAKKERVERRIFDLICMRDALLAAQPVRE